MRVGLSIVASSLVCAGCSTTREVVRTERVVHTERMAPDQVRAELGDDAEIVVELDNGRRHVWPRGTTMTRLVDGLAMNPGNGQDIEVYDDDAVVSVETRRFETRRFSERVSTPPAAGTVVITALLVTGLAVAVGAAAAAEMDDALSWR